MKRFLVVSLLLLLALPGSVAKMKAQAKDEAGIRKTFAEFAEAWAKDDAKGMASYWAADGDLINPEGKRANGRAEIEALLADEHATVFKGTHFTFGEGTIHFVKPDVAVFTTDFEVPGAHGPDGNEMTVKGILTTVMVKKRGKWWTLSARPMVPIPPPQQ
ncbi:MAG: YybH family protein [Terriglobia bacterium]